MTPTNILEQLQRDEGLRLYSYTDTAGKITIGFGHNLQANPIAGVTDSITIKQAIDILSEDIEDITDQLVIALPGTPALDKARFGVLQNMAFNMGVTGLLGFTNFLAYLQTSQWDSAAAAMMASRWSKQVGLRAYRLSEQVRTGLWQ